MRLDSKSYDEPEIEECRDAEEYFIRREELEGQGYTHDGSVAIECLEEELELYSAARQFSIVILPHFYEGDEGLTKSEEFVELWAPFKEHTF